VQDHESKTMTKEIKCWDKTGAREINSHGEVMWVMEADGIYGQRGGAGGGGGQGPTCALNASLPPHEGRFQQQVKNLE
jgi:hypothetical protein